MFIKHIILKDQLKNAIGCQTSEISRFADRHLQPVVKEIPSYLKDTNYFINKVNVFFRSS